MLTVLPVRQRLRADLRRRVPVQCQFEADLLPSQRTQPLLQAPLSLIKPVALALHVSLQLRHNASGDNFGYIDAPACIALYTP